MSIKLNRTTTGFGRDYMNNENENWDIIEKNYNNITDKSNQTASSVDLAINTANEANQLSNNVQKQLDEVVIKGDSSLEAAQARIDVYGGSSKTLKERLDKEQVRLSTINEDFYGNQAKKKGISVTITNSSTSATYTNWASQLSNISCEIELCVMETISTDTSTDFTPVTNIAAKVAEVKNTLKKPITIIKPHIGTATGGDSFYRGNYNPSDINSFFTNWGNRLKDYAQICKDNNIPVLCITCEQTNQTVNTYLSNWKSIISACKTIYPQLKITVAYTRFEAGRDLYQYGSAETLLDNMDIVGVNYYPNMLRNEAKKYFFGYLDSQGMQNHNNNTGVFRMDEQIINLKSRYQKPIYIMEIGCSEYKDTSNTMEIVATYIGTSIDRSDQAIYLENTLNYLVNNANIDGFFLWHINSPFSVVTTEVKPIVQKYLN
ncbi:glycoside hydrolase family 113 [Bacillus sp. BP-3]|uniref:glycoside hydrolase family 113 n=1 Tax=Bacillus sp. BP-3 TaxID=3022773 RepID=UPI00232F63A5|nr:hypothetical protein [Bacillus sp. BP-3]MDC2867556.1 hypothetical protein [Bacillus sp. BP-3]